MEDCIDDTLPAPAAAPRIRYFSPWLVVFTLVWLVAYVRFFPSPGALAARNWPLILIGVAEGWFSCRR